MDWIYINDKAPQKGTRCLCKFNIWRHGTKVGTGEQEAEYLGINEATTMPHFDIETHDEYYAEITHWKPTI